MMDTTQRHRNPRRITSQDVADYADVSRATVSAVVNRSRYVSEELVSRVEKAIEVLGYKPNILASGLKTRRTHTIGLVMPNVLSPVWALITRSVEVRARELGFNIIVCDTDEDLDTERTCIDLLSIKQVDGIIIAPCSIDSATHLRAFVEEKPLVTIDRQLIGIDVDYVTPDKISGTHMAVMNLFDQGARRIAIVGNMILGQEPYLDDEWLGGYNKALREVGLPIDKHLIRIGRRGPHSERDGYRNTLELLRHPERPDAIVACTHFTTMGVLRAARELGIQIPEDVALIGYDELIYNEYINPSLSVVDQPWEQAGKLSVDLLVRRIHTKSTSATRTKPVERILPVELIIRESSSLTETVQVP